MKITVSDIAKKAGVSASTVSRVMSGEVVSEEKRLRVQAVLAGLEGYQARPRRKRGIGIQYIGIICLPQSHFDESSMNAKLVSMLDSLPANWRLLHLPGNISAFELEMAWRRRDISGLVVFGHRAPNLEGVLQTIPHVWMNSHNTEGHEPEILAGNEQAGRMAGRYLYEKGCRHPLVLKIASINPGVQSRVDGFNFEFYTRLGANRVTICPVWGISLEEKDEDKLEYAISEAVSPDGLQNCDGIFAPEAILAAVLHRILTKRKLTVFPLMVTCNGNNGYLRGLYPRPATIDLGPEFLSHLAMEQLFAKISGDDSKARRTSVIVNPSLILGDE